jgi:glutathione S-transferase
MSGDRLGNCIPGVMAEASLTISSKNYSSWSLRGSALPMNLKAVHPGFKVWAGAQADIERVTAIWRECLQAYGGPYLFGKTATVADAMYAPVCSRFATYDVKLDAASAGYRDLMMKFPAMLEWTLAAKSEPEEVEELDVEF